MKIVSRDYNDIIVDLERKDLGTLEKPGLKSLADLTTNTRGIVHQLQGGKNFVSRMGALGFTAGAEVKVVQNYRQGPLIVLVRDTRVALGQGEAQKVWVRETNDGQEPGDLSTN
jgi:ferrous iron transport protein A